MVVSPRNRRLTLLLPVLGSVFFSCHGPDDIVATLSVSPSDGGADSTGGDGSGNSFSGTGGDPSFELRPLTGDLEVHDPAVAFSRGTFFLFHTGSLLPLKLSQDIVHWQTADSAFEMRPDWVVQLVPEATGLWAPELIEFGGLFHLYYAASTFGTGLSCIGHATTDELSVNATWEDRGPLICSDIDEPVDWDAIDPGVFRDADGAYHMVFGSYSSGIKMIHLNSEGSRADDSLIAIAERPVEIAIQAPAAMYHAPYYYLFSTFDRCCAGVESTSNIRVGRSVNLEGPYVDRDGVALLEGGGTVLIEGTTLFPGVGASSLLSLNDQSWIFYHAYDANAAGRATLRISELEWDDENWPTASSP